MNILKVLHKSNALLFMVFDVQFPLIIILSYCTSFYLFQAQTVSSALVHVYIYIWLVYTEQHKFSSGL